MEQFGTNWPLVLAQVFNLLLVLGWAALAVAALVGLRRRALPPRPTAIWAALILLAPILGALAFFIALPARRADA
jgi:hypothetical protein